MNKMMKQLSAAALLVAGAVGGAQAAAISTVATDTQDVVFGTSGTATITIIPMTGLKAGRLADSIKVAHMSAAVSIGDVAVRWTPGSGIIDPDGNGGGDYGTNVIIVSGKNTSTPMKVRAWSVTSKSSPSSPEWWTPFSGGSSMIQSIETVGAQTVLADTYPFSMDAAVWQE